MGLLNMTLTTRIAKSVIKNKFWVVEDGGEKVATIQATEDGGCVYVHNEKREHFPSVTLLKKKYNIRFTSSNIKNNSNTNLVYGYPVIGKVYNPVYDVQRKFAVFTKTLKSRSLFCAGYFIIKTDNEWIGTFCPKNLTLNRYNYIGPFKTPAEMTRKLKEMQ